MWGVVTRLGRKGRKVEGNDEAALRDAIYCCKEWTGRRLGSVGRKVCVFGRRRGELVQDQGPGEERTEKHPIRDPLARCRLRVAGVQVQAQASKRHWQANAN